MQIQQNPTLTREDLQLLDKNILAQMMRNRIVLAFDKVPLWDKIKLDEIQGMYYLDRIDREGTTGWSTGGSDKTYHLWFELPVDKDNFLRNIAELKLST
mgnify:CR=1 FL=1